jgi:hypothetical protein
LLIADMSRFQCSSCLGALQHIEGGNYARSLFILL